MSYRIAGVDVHKKILAVVVSDVEVDGKFRFERRLFGSNPEQLRLLTAWLVEHGVQEVVMESTAQYWKPVWEALERLANTREGTRRSARMLHLAQALSNRGRRGRNRDFVDAERLLKRLVARELNAVYRRLLKMARPCVCAAGRDCISRWNKPLRPNLRPR